MTVLTVPLSLHLNFLGGQLAMEELVSCPAAPFWIKTGYSVCSSGRRGGVGVGGSVYCCTHGSGTYNLFQFLSTDLCVVFCFCSPASYSILCAMSYSSYMQGSHKTQLGGCYNSFVERQRARPRC